WLGTLSATRLAEEMKKCSAMIVPSLMENYGLGLSEAMALGMPTVCSFVGCLPDLAADEDSALFFPPGDVPACAFQLERIFTDWELASRISESARKQALLQYNPERILMNQLGVYRQVLADNLPEKITDI
ncbi:MAG: glycosyltransferase, partial [Candidatus Latescibacterota bacterium]